MDDACTNWAEEFFLAYAQRGDWHPSPHCRCVPFAVCSREVLERGHPRVVKGLRRPPSGSQRHCGECIQILTGDACSPRRRLRRIKIPALGIELTSGIFARGPLPCLIAVMREPCGCHDKDGRPRLTLLRLRSLWQVRICVRWFWQRQAR